MNKDRVKDYMAGVHHESNQQKEEPEQPMDLDEDHPCAWCDGLPPEEEPCCFCGK